jgi:uncharacterized protein YcfL
MKKLFGIFAVAGLLFVACNNKPAEPVTEEQTPVVEQPAVQEPAAPAVQEPVAEVTTKPAHKTTPAVKKEEPKKEEPKKEEPKKEEPKAPAQQKRR